MSLVSTTPHLALTEATPLADAEEASAVEVAAEALTAVDVVVEAVVEAVVAVVTVVGVAGRGGSTNRGRLRRLPG